ncbi:tRNA1(Val) (adenine(37)-N6)-methyltransferase [Flavobacterium okayamense]|uniref:tRNA1(Val) (adenine(37)-N6)-methyltransferase n=1 Tax=Flavobacterium okayamense TaxID=2830782 RepID=A0ABM7S9N7_9FLAO|nr:methyltransferase [Flavobacterium okayamense]BCY28068.1 tRNA1(Val) (adenine(37)-N6)-methyltransferase [Flavobacterium okayamense]
MPMAFQFKQFSIEQDKCAMKVGTDGVLLGAWATLENNPYSILDVGSGTGLIALMLAQRSYAEQIDALEIDEDAYEQCVENFENSSWSDRLFCYHASFQEFVEEMYEEEKYDLIVSNPPFYTAHYKSENEQRDLARFEDALPFDHLLHGSSLLLSENGVFCVIIPYSEEKNFISIATHFELFPSKITRVKGTPTSEIKRSLIAFSKNQTKTYTDELVIETARHQYTEEYKILTQDFYLKM